MPITSFPPSAPGRFYLTEGGIETEIMYKWGHELPEFAMFPLLDIPKAKSDMQDMWRRYFEVAAQNEFIPLVSGLDYRASPDWGAKLGYSPASLAEAQHQCVDFLRELIAEFDFQTSYIVGSVGPRGDAYSLNCEITVEGAQEYHAVQLQTLKDANADMACAMTFNNIPEAIGVARAAAEIDIPIAISLTLSGDAKLKSGPSLKDAIAAIDEDPQSNPALYMLNCSHPLEFEPAFDGGEWQSKIRCIRPNASAMEKIALCKIGHLEDGDPAELGNQIAEIARRHPAMDIFGGCCGTDDRHLDAIAKSVRRVREDQSD